MSKILGSVLVVSLLLITTSNVFAAAPVSGCELKHDISIGDVVTAKGTELVESDANWGMLCLLDTVYSVTDWIFYGLLSLVSTLTIYGGFKIVTAGGNADQVTEGRNYVLYATVGLIVAFLSKVIPSIAEGIVGA